MDTNIVTLLQKGNEKIKNINASKNQVFTNIENNNSFLMNDMNSLPIKMTVEQFDILKRLLANKDEQIEYLESMISALTEQLSITNNSLVEMDYPVTTEYKSELERKFK